MSDCKKIRIGIVFALTLGLSVSAQEIHKAGRNIVERFIPPKEYTRIQYASDSFMNYLRTYPLKEYDAPVLLYNGEEKWNKVYVSVFAMPILNVDLIQCADAVMKLRAEYLYEQGRYADISFQITNGMSIPFSKYRDGYRAVASGGTVSWKGGYAKGTARSIFDEYLKFIYMYAGTYSLAHEARKKNISQIQAGDFFIYGGNPGHVVLVLDLAVDKKTGEKIMLLGQSYMPSQEFHVLKSFESISPWYYVRDEELQTPEWSFAKNSLMSFE